MAPLEDSFAMLDSVAQRIEARPSNGIQLNECKAQLEATIRSIYSFELSGHADATRLATLLRRIDELRCALLELIVSYDRARARVVQLQELIKGGHVRQAIIARHVAEREIAEFSDLDLSFIAEAEARQLQQQKHLLVGCLIAFGVLILIGTIVELMKRELVK